MLNKRLWQICAVNHVESEVRDPIADRGARNSEWERFLRSCKFTARMLRATLRTNKIIIIIETPMKKFHHHRKFITEKVA